MRNLITQTALVLLLGAVPAFAGMNTGSERLFVGRVASISPQEHQLVVTSGDHSQMTFGFGDHTWVYGVSKGHHVTDLTSGDAVIVQYTETDKGLVAYVVKHPSDGLPLVAAADARVIRFDQKHRDVVLEMPAGESGSEASSNQNQTFHISKRASIEEGQLLIQYHDLSLKPGDLVTVYYTTDNGTRTIDALKYSPAAASGL